MGCVGRGSHYLESRLGSLTVFPETHMMFRVVLLYIVARCWHCCGGRWSGNCLYLSFVWGLFMSRDLKTNKPPLKPDKAPLETKKPPPETDQPPLETDKPPLETDKPPLKTTKLPLHSERPSPVPTPQYHHGTATAATNHD